MVDAHIPIKANGCKKSPHCDIKLFHSLSRRVFACFLWSVHFSSTLPLLEIIKISLDVGTRSGNGWFFCLAILRTQHTSWHKRLYLAFRLIVLFLSSLPEVQLTSRGWNLTYGVSGWRKVVYPLNTGRDYEHHAHLLWLFHIARRPGLVCKKMLPGERLFCKTGRK